MPKEKRVRKAKAELTAAIHAVEDAEELHDLAHDAWNLAERTVEQAELVLEDAWRRLRDVERKHGLKPKGWRPPAAAEDT